MQKEAEEAGEAALDGLKQRVFASAFGSPDPRAALKQYYDTFEKDSEPEPEEMEQFEPESESDVMEMMNLARRAGAIK